jgi:hypothetical protein
MTNFLKYLKNSRLKITLPFLSYDITFEELSNSKNVDERISKLGEIREDLQGAIEAVETLQIEAVIRKSEVE